MSSVTACRLIRWAAALALLVAASLTTQAAGRTEGLADAKRVLREAAASSDADAAARRYATLLTLSAAARRVTTADGARPEPEDMALVSGYNRAIQQLMREVAQSGPANCAGEQCPAALLTQRSLALARSAGFAQGVIQKFSSPAWQQAHMAALFARPGGAAVKGDGAAPGPQTAPSAPGTTSAIATPPVAAPVTHTAQATPARSIGTLPRGFEFLAQLPTVERVLREVRGSDAVDTKVQQEATFLLLAMDVMLAMRNGAPQVPGRFNELDRAYKAEVLRIEHELRAEVAPSTLSQAEQAQRWAPIFKQLWAYQASKPFREQTFKRFFTPDLVAAYKVRKGEFDVSRQSSIPLSGAYGAPPVTVTSCDKGGCWTSDGNRMPQIVNGVLIGPNGGLCNTVGATLNCP